MKITGIHHITAIASDPQQNLDFYAGLLGLRLVKLTVNFDDNGTYHFYFGGSQGQPGTILTFFPWPNAKRGQVGSGQVSAVAYSIPPGAYEYWQQRLQEHGIPVSPGEGLAGERALNFQDPDGMQLQLVEDLDSLASLAWEEGPVPGEYALRGFYKATLLEEDGEEVARLLEDTFGLRKTTLTNGETIFQTGSPDQPGARIEVLARPEETKGRMGAGIIHHIAWRTPDDDQQLEWRNLLREKGLQVTPVRDRQYFHSIYFYEPEGILFEIATDQPGFLIDEGEAELGSSLKLPPWLEPKRQELEEILPELRLPGPSPARRVG